MRNPECASDTADHERHIDLLKGQALFHVTKDPARPFIVDTGETQVRVRSVRSSMSTGKATATIVTVVEGRVAVQSTGAAAAVGAKTAQRANPRRSAGLPRGGRTTCRSTSVRR